MRDPTQGAFKVRAFGFAGILHIDDEHTVALQVEEQLVVVSAHNLQVGGFGVAREAVAQGVLAHVIDVDMGGAL